jgi:hypothetical protein
MCGAIDDHIHCCLSMLRDSGHNVGSLAAMLESALLAELARGRASAEPLPLLLLLRVGLCIATSFQIRSQAQATLVRLLGAACATLPTVASRRHRALICRAACHLAFVHDAIPVEPGVLSTHVPAADALAWSCAQALAVAAAQVSQLGDADGPPAQASIPGAARGSVPVTAHEVSAWRGCPEVMLELSARLYAWPDEGRVGSEAHGSAVTGCSVQGSAVQSSAAQRSRLERLLQATLLHSTVLLRSRSPSLRAAALRAVRQMLGMAGIENRSEGSPAGRESPNGGVSHESLEECALDAWPGEADGCGEGAGGGVAGRFVGSPLSRATSSAGAEAWEAVWASLMQGSEAQDAEVRADCLRAAADLHEGGLPPGTGLGTEVARRLLWRALDREIASPSSCDARSTFDETDPASGDTEGRDAIGAGDSAVASAGRLVVAVEGGACAMQGEIGRLSTQGGAGAWATLLRLHAVLRRGDARSLLSLWPRDAAWWVGEQGSAEGPPAAEGMRAEAAQGGAAAGWVNGAAGESADAAAMGNMGDSAATEEAGALTPPPPSRPGCERPWCERPWCERPPSWPWCEQLLRCGLSHPVARRRVAERFLRRLAEVLQPASDAPLPPVSFVTGAVLPVVVECSGGMLRQVVGRSRLAEAVERCLPLYAVALERREGHHACCAFLDAWTHALCEAAPRLPAVALARALRQLAEAMGPAAILSGASLSSLQEAARRFTSALDWAREEIRDCLLAGVSRLTLAASTGLDPAMRLVAALPLCPIAHAAPAMLDWLGEVGDLLEHSPEAWLEAQLSAAAALYFGRCVCTQEPTALQTALRQAKVDARVLAWSARLGVGDVSRNVSRDMSRDVSKDVSRDASGDGSRDVSVLRAWERCGRLLLAPACDRLSRTRQHAYAHTLEAPLLLLLLAELLSCLPPQSLPCAARMVARCEEALAAFATEGRAWPSLGPSVACECGDEAPDWQAAREACCAAAATACVRCLPMLPRLATIAPSLRPPCGANCGRGGGGEGSRGAGEGGLGSCGDGASQGEEASSDGSEEEDGEVSSRVRVWLQVASADRMAEELAWPLRQQAVGLG